MNDKCADISSKLQVKFLDMFNESVPDGTGPEEVLNILGGSFFLAPLLIIRGCIGEERMKIFDELSEKNAELRSISVECFQLMVTRTLEMIEKEEKKLNGSR